jgi:hypothetical protein
MADRALRGMRLGTQSKERVEGAELAERIEVTYDCPAGHVTTLPFSIEAEIPGIWDCHCGAAALRRHSAVAEERPVRHSRTHWDMLLERRTIPELEALLEERLAILRENRMAS